VELVGHISQYACHKQRYCIGRRDQTDPPIRRARVEGRLGHDQRFGLEKNLVQWLSKALREGVGSIRRPTKNDEFVIEVFSQPCQCAAQSRWAQIELLGGFGHILMSEQSVESNKEV